MESMNKKSIFIYIHGLLVFWIIFSFTVPLLQFNKLQIENKTYLVLIALNAGIGLFLFIKLSLYKVANLSKLNMSNLPSCILLALGLFVWLLGSYRSDIPGQWALPAGFIVGTIAAKNSINNSKIYLILCYSVICAFCNFLVDIFSGINLIQAVFESFRGGLYSSIVALSIWGLHYLGHMIMKLEQTQSLLAEQAVVKERLRFAADLHDIQGQSLKVITLKTQILESYINSNDHKASKVVEEIDAIARQALQDTNNVVLGFQRQELETELNNSRELLKSFGTVVKAELDTRIIPQKFRAFTSDFFREITTNIISHSQANNVEFKIQKVIHHSRNMIELSSHNNMCHVAAVSLGAGTGLKSLENKIMALGGSINVENTSDAFFIQAFLPNDD